MGNHPNDYKEISTLLSCQWYLWCNNDRSDPKITPQKYLRIFKLMMANYHFFDSNSSCTIQTIESDSYVDSLVDAKLECDSDKNSGKVAFNNVENTHISNNAT